MARRPKYEIHITRAARRDMIAIMKWSLKEFGEDAARRYDALMTQALRDIGADPERLGALQRSELAKDVLVYHLGFSRDRTRSGLGLVRNPRHFLIYRCRGQAPVMIDILRVLHDSRDLARHLPDIFHRRD